MSSGKKEEFVSGGTRPKGAFVFDIVVCFREEGGARLLTTRPSGLVCLRLLCVSGKKEELLS